MREIKFRGFRVNENGNTVITVNGKDYKGEWVYGSLLDLVTGIYISPIDTSYNEIDVDLGQKITINAMWEDNDFFEVLPETVGQFTGLLDKNGKEVYEGDIVKCVSELYSGFGKYPTGEFSTTYYEICSINENAYCFGERRVGEKDIFEGILRDCAKKYYEVIGNIFDNPELLESEATK